MAEVRFRLSRLPVVIVFALVTVPAICFGDSTEAGSWFVNELKYHISVHGQISCQDCHSEIIRRSVHPNPADVTRSRSEFFNSEICFSCHDRDSLETNLEKGLHGGKPIEKARNYSNCITCHDPHYQRSLSKKTVSGVEVAAQGPGLCGKCHERKESLPLPAGQDAECLQCHKAIDSRDNDKIKKIATFCLKCHGTKVRLSGATVAVPLVDTSKHISEGHSRLDCMNCHLDGARFEHNRQASVNCRQCHTPHHESTIHDAHATVSCQACHLGGVKPRRDRHTGRIMWAKSPGTKQLNIVRPDVSKSFCRKCHHSGNTVAAAAMVLPAKSVICMPCHPATLSAKDTVSVLALLGFGVGMCVVASVWLSAIASPRSGEESGLVRRSKLTPGTRLIPLMRSLFLDVLLQRRLFVRSRSRWFVHGLIFWPIVLRFTWGLVALVGSLVLPTHDWVWSLLDKNNPLTAFVFDFTGVMIIAGILVAVFRKRIASEDEMKGLPESDWWAIGLLGAIVIVGFGLEGARIALTAPVSGARFAFVGWALSFLWRGIPNLSEIYGYVWYLHAFLTGAFLVYLPFSKLFHVIMAPLVMILNALDSSHDREGQPPHAMP